MLRTGGRKGLRGTKHAPKARSVFDSLVGRELPRTHITPLLGDCSSSGNAPTSSFDAASVPHDERAPNGQITYWRKGKSEESAYHDDFPPLDFSRLLPSSIVTPACTRPMSASCVHHMSPHPPPFPLLGSLSTAQLKREAMAVTESLLRKSLRCDDARATALGVGLAMRAAAHLMHEEKAESEPLSQSQWTHISHVRALPLSHRGAAKGANGGKGEAQRGNAETTVPCVRGRGTDMYKASSILAEPCSLDRRSSFLSFRKKKAVETDAPLCIATKHNLSPSPSPSYFFTRRELSTIIIPALVQLHANWVPRSWADIPTRVTDGTVDISIGNACRWDTRGKGTSNHHHCGEAAAHHESSAKVSHGQRRSVIRVLLRRLLGGLRVEDCGVRRRESQYGGGAAFVDDGGTQNLMLRGYPKYTLEGKSLPPRRFSFAPPYRGVMVSPSAVGRIMLQHERDDNAFSEKPDYEMCGRYSVAERRVATASLLEVLIAFNDKSTVVNPLLSRQPVVQQNTTQQKVELADLRSFAPLSEALTSQSALAASATVAGIGNFPSPSTSNHKNESKYRGFCSLEALSIFNLGAIDPLDRLYFCVRHPDPSGNDFRPPLLTLATERPTKLPRTKQTAASLFPSSDVSVPHSVFTSGRWRVLDPRQCIVREDYRTSREEVSSDTQIAYSDSENYLLQSPTTPRRPPKPRWLARPYREANTFLDMAMRAQTSAFHDNTRGSLTRCQQQKGSAESRRKRTTTSSTPPPMHVSPVSAGREKSFDFLRDPLWFKAHALAWLRNEARVEMAGTLFVPTKVSANAKNTPENNAAKRRSTRAPTTNLKVPRSSIIPQMSVGASTFSMRLCGVKQPSVELSGQLRRSFSDSTEIENKRKMTGSEGDFSDNGEEKGEEQLAICQTLRDLLFDSDSRKWAAAHFNLFDFAASAQRVESQKGLWARVCALRAGILNIKSGGGNAIHTTSGWLRRAPWRSFEKCVERSAKAALVREDHFESHNSSMSAVISPFADANAYAFPYWIDALTVKQMNLRLLPNARGLLMTDSMMLSGLLGVRDLATIRTGLAVAAVGDFYDNKIAQITAAAATAASVKEEREEAPTSLSLHDTCDNAVVTVPTSPPPPPSLAVHYSTTQESLPPPRDSFSGAKTCISTASLLDSIVADGISADLSIDLLADDESHGFENEEGLTQGSALVNLQNPEKEGTTVCKSALLGSVTTLYLATDLGVGRSETVAMEDAARGWRSESPISRASINESGNLLEGAFEYFPQKEHRLQQRPSANTFWGVVCRPNHSSSSAQDEVQAAGVAEDALPDFYSCEDVIWAHNAEQIEDEYSTNESASSLLQKLLEWLEDLELSETSRSRERE